MKALRAQWRRLMARRRWQWVYDAEPGWYIVLTHLGPRATEPDERWEVELTSPERRTRLYYHPTRRAAMRDLRSLGIKPVRRAKR